MSFKTDSDFPWINIRDLPNIQLARSLTDDRKSRVEISRKDRTEIKELCRKGGVSQKVIAKKYGISQGCVSVISREKP